MEIFYSLIREQILKVLQKAAAVPLLAVVFAKLGIGNVPLK